MLICSEPFRAMANAERIGFAMPDLEVLVVAHPIHSKSRELLQAEVDDLMPQVRRFFRLTEPPAG